MMHEPIVKCASCRGSGLHEGPFVPIVCRRCHGHGIVPTDLPNTADRDRPSTRDPGDTSAPGFGRRRTLSFPIHEEISDEDM